MIREYGRTVSETEVNVEQEQRNERKEFGQNLATMSDDELYDALQKAVGLRQREEFREAWPSLDTLIELLNRFIAIRD